MNAKEFTKLVNGHSSVKGFVPMELHCGLPVLVRGEGKWLLQYIYYGFDAQPGGIVIGAPVCAVQFSFPRKIPEAMFRLKAGAVRGLYSEVITDPAGCMARESAYFSALDTALTKLESGGEPSPEDMARLGELLLEAVPQVLTDDYKSCID